MTASLSVKRTRSAIRQGYRCYYCGLPMWDKDPESFGSQYRLSSRQTRLLRCTAEHLRARSDGGANATGNVVAACWYCNSHRHMARQPLDPPQYRVRVNGRMARGGWLAGVVPHLVSRA